MSKAPMSLSDAIRYALPLVRDAYYNSELDDDEEGSWAPVVATLEGYLSILEDPRLNEMLGTDDA